MSKFPAVKDLAAPQQEPCLLDVREIEGQTKEARWSLMKGHRVGQLSLVVGLRGFLKDARCVEGQLPSRGTGRPRLRRTHSSVCSLV